MTVDPKSFKLARHFLQDHEPVATEVAVDLANAIQPAVEDWFVATFPGPVPEQS